MCVYSKGLIGSESDIKCIRNWLEHYFFLSIHCFILESFSVRAEDKNVNKMSN